VEMSGLYWEIQSPVTTDEDTGLKKYFKFIKKRSEPVSEDCVNEKYTC